MVKNLMGRAVRSASPKAARYVETANKWMRYVFEYTTTDSKFYVAEIHALTLMEAKHELTGYLRKQNQQLLTIDRMYDHGADRSWMHGKRNSWTTGASRKKEVAHVVDVRMYDRKLFEQLRLAN